MKDSIRRVYMYITLSICSVRTLSMQPGNTKERSDWLDFVTLDCFICKLHAVQ